MELEQVHGNGLADRFLFGKRWYGIMNATAIFPENQGNKETRRHFTKEKFSVFTQLGV